MRRNFPPQTERTEIGLARLSALSRIVFKAPKSGLFCLVGGGQNHKNDMTKSQKKELTKSQIGLKIKKTSFSFTIKGIQLRLEEKHLTFGHKQVKCILVK